MKIQIQSGGKSVVGSGSVISFNNDPVTLSLCDIMRAGDNLTVTFRFSKDQSIKGMKTSLTGEGTSVAFDLINYDNSLGQGVAAPVEFAHTGDGRKLYISFIVYTLSEGGAKKISFSIYKDR